MARRYIVSAYRKQIDKAIEHIQFAQQIGTDIGVLQYHLQEALKALNTSTPKASETKAQREKENDKLRKTNVLGGRVHPQHSEHRHDTTADDGQVRRSRGILSVGEPPGD